MSLSNQQPFYMFAHLLFPVVTAVVIFRYLQGISSVSIMHSMPFTRLKLYNSNFVSGLILILSPIFLNGLILLAISKPVYGDAIQNGVSVDAAINLFARSTIGNWMWESLLIVLVIYAISVFAGIVTGTSLMHFVTAAWFNFLIPSLYAIFIVYFSYFLFGFDYSGNWMDVCLRISPFLQVFSEDGKFGLGVELYYIFNFVALYIVTAILYNKRKLEYATDTLTFKFMHPIICYLIAFLGMTALGFYFYALKNTDLYLYAGFVAGTIIFFIIGRMIVKKSPRIFNLKSLRSLAIYSLIAILFIVTLKVDVSGFENRVPRASNIESFSISDSFMPNGFLQGLYQNRFEIDLKDAENVKAILAFHQSVVQQKDRFSKEVLENSYNMPITIGYDYVGSSSMSRKYDIDYDYFRSSAEMKQIFESKEFKKAYSLKNFVYDKINVITLNSAAYDGESNIGIADQGKISEFLAALEKDLRKKTFQDMISLQHSYASVNIDFTYKNTDPNQGMVGEMMSNSIYYDIGYHDINTIQWIEAQGYSSQLQEKIEDIAYIKIWHYTDMAKGDAYEKMQANPETSFPSKEDPSLKIDNPSQMQALIDNYENRINDYQDYYCGQIVYKDADASDKVISEKEMEKYGDDTVYGDMIYFNGDNVPDYVLNYFK